MTKPGDVALQEIDNVKDGDRDPMTDHATLCGASAADAHDPLGPCILRAGHDGPVHLDAEGTKWADPEPEPLADWERKLLDEEARDMTNPRLSDLVAVTVVLPGERHGLLSTRCVRVHRGDVPRIEALIKELSR